MAELHIWQPASGGDTLAAGSWDTAAPAVQATGTGTFTGQPVALETVSIGARTYTWKASVGSTADEVKIGADAAGSRDNLVAAVNADPAGAGTQYGSDTAANADITAVANDTGGTKIELTSIKYGTGPNSLATTDTTTNFSFAGATLSGGLTNWAIDGTAEILINEENHSDLTAHLDWEGLLSPAIPIQKITRKAGNFSRIGSSGSPWRVRGTSSNANFLNFSGAGDVYFESTSGGSFQLIQDGPFFCSIGGVLKGLSVRSGHCQCSAEFGIDVGGKGTVVNVVGPSARLEILDSTKNPAGLLIAVAGRVENARDLILGNWIIVKDAHVLQTGKMEGVDDGAIIVGAGVFSHKPRALSSPTTGIYALSGDTSFEESKFTVPTTKVVIGPKARFNEGPVSAITGQIVDLRENYL